MPENRLDKLRDRMARKGLDALLVTDLANVFYLSGFTGSSGALIVTPKDEHILVDPRYTVQAAAECVSAQVVRFTGKSTVTAAAEHLKELGAGQVGYEAYNLTVNSFRELRKGVERGVRLRSTRGLVEELRRVKDAHEIELIRTAAAIADAAFEAVMLELKPGVTEKEVALLIDVTLRKMGADKEAFETIAASGPRSALPHARTTDAIIKQNQLLLMDFGARYRSYNSDITRTVVLGKPTKKQKEVYQIVLDAQRLAIEAIAPGKQGREIDAVARDYIASHGYGDAFGHGLGHGIGITVHDHAALAPPSDIILEPGMVITVEPGIYIESWGGVRIEDDVVVGEKGAEVLTAAAKEPVLPCLA